MTSTVKPGGCCQAPAGMRSRPTEPSTKPWSGTGLFVFLFVSLSSTHPFTGGFFLAHKSGSWSVSIKMFDHFENQEVTTWTWTCFHYHRCIRHKNDCGALILVDDRFGNNPNKYISGTEINDRRLQPLELELLKQTLCLRCLTQCVVSYLGHLVVMLVHKIEVCCGFKDW